LIQVRVALMIWEQLLRVLTLIETKFMIADLLTLVKNVVLIPNVIQSVSLYREAVITRVS